MAIPKVRKQLPARARIDQLKRQAKDLLASFRERSSEAFERVRASHPRFTREGASEDPRDATLILADTQLVIAREYGFRSWVELRRRVETIDLADPRTAFVEAACVPMDGASHHSGDLAHADAILAQHPQLAEDDLYVAAILGNAAAVRNRVEREPDATTATGGLYDWDALTYLCFSRYLRLDAARSEGFLSAARALLTHGASASTGFYWQDHEPEPCFESALYGAAGIAHHPELTRLLLEHGADPNDDETPYHVPETYDNRALHVLVESGRLNERSMTWLLIRKLDWHDRDAVEYLLARGANPNTLNPLGRTAVHWALRRNNRLPILELLLAHGGDPSLTDPDGSSAVALAARMGRADALEAFAKRGFAVLLDESDALLAECARGDGAAARARIARAPERARALEAAHPAILADFAGAGNTAGVALLLDLGFSITARTTSAAAPDDPALHVALWRGRAETARLLIERGAPLEDTNRRGETALMYAVRACVRSEWTPRLPIDTVAELLRAGAHVDRVVGPTGSEALDALLRAHGWRAE